MTGTGDVGGWPGAASRQTLARLLTWIESGDPRAVDAEALFAGQTGGAHVIGITGAPGAGKSTLTNRLVASARARGDTAGVIAVDPSSAFTGGALLGDRIRMAQHVGDEGVFIRSMANRGHLGGLARALPRAVRALDAFGFGWIVVETVGVGQAEIEVIDQADTTVVVVNPRWGDGIQTSKAGVLEIADMFVINKADRPGVDATRQDLDAALDLSRPGEWRPPIVSTVAETGEGVDDLLNAITSHGEYLNATGERARRRRTRHLAELRAAAHDLALTRLDAELGNPRHQAITEQVADGSLSPSVAARSIVLGQPAALDR